MNASGSRDPAHPRRDGGEPQDAGGDRPRLGSNYWRLFSASAAANLGDGLMAIAVVWLASALTRDAAVIALVGLASRLPWLIFSLPAGVLSDRFDRRRIVGSMDLVRCVVVAVFAVVLLIVQDDVPTPEALAAGADEPANGPLLIGALCLLALVLGFAEVLRDNTAQTLMPAVVHDRVLARANGRLWGAEVTMNQFVGPPLAGLLIAVAIVIPFAGNAVLLLVSGLLVLSLRGSFAPTGERTTGRVNWRGEIGEGFRWLWRRPVMRSLALALGAMNMASSIGAVVFVLFAQEVLGLFDGWAFGVLLSGAAVGAVLGSLVADRIAGVLGDARSLLLAVAAMGVTLGAVGLLSTAWLVWVAQLLSGVAVVLWNVISVTLRQRLIPDHLRGRVNSVYRFFGWGSISIGTLLGGLLVAWLEPGLGREWALRAPFLVAGAGYLVMTLYVARAVTAEKLADAGAPRVGEH